MDPQHRATDPPATREDLLQATIDSIDTKLRRSSSQKPPAEQRKEVEETLIIVNSRQQSSADLLAVLERIEGKKKKSRLPPSSAQKPGHPEAERDQECLAFAKRLNENITATSSHSTRLSLMIKELEAKVHPAGKQALLEQPHARQDSLKAAIDQSGGNPQLAETTSNADASSMKRYLDCVKKDLFKKKDAVEGPLGDMQPAFSYKAGDILSYFEQEKKKIYRKAHAELAKPASTIGKHLTLEDFSKGANLGRQAPPAQLREVPRRSRSRQAATASTGLLLLKRDRSLASLDSRAPGGQLSDLISKIDRRSPRKAPQLLEREHKLLSSLQPPRLSTPAHLGTGQQIRRKFFN